MPTIIKLNNPYLSALGIKSEFESEQSKHIKRGQQQGPMPIDIVRAKLKKMYFFEISEASVLTEIEAPTFAAFPQLQDMLRQVFTDPPPGTLVLNTELNDAELHQAGLEDAFEVFLQQSILAKEDPLDRGKLRAVFHGLGLQLIKMQLLVEKQAYSSDMIAKLMLLFYDSRLGIEGNIKAIIDQFANLFKAFDKDLFRGGRLSPYHDVLLTVLSHPAEGINLADLMQWRVFINHIGTFALPYFNQAELFEVVPSTLREARENAASHKFKRAKEDIKFANLCKALSIEETTFNQALDFINDTWPKKTSDSLPDLTITVTDGSDTYVWVKLKPEDKAAFFLGNLTACCQRIDGDSSQCVKDGISLSDNGFYVLLKAKTVPPDPNTHIGQEINHQAYSIVAQSYIWRSKYNNICLDSIESSSKVPVTVLKKVARDFAQHVIDTDPMVNYVTVGRGGATPQQMGQRAIVPETLRQGFHYGDASSQSILGSRYPLQPVTFDLPLSRGTPEYLFTFIAYAYPYFDEVMRTDYMNNISTILSTPETQRQFIQKIDTLIILGELLKKEDFLPLDFSTYQALSLEEQASVSSAKKIWNIGTSEQLLQWWPMLTIQEKLMLLKEEQLEPPETLLVSIFKNHQDRFIEILAELPEQELLSLINKTDKKNQSIVHLAASTSDQSILFWLLGRLPFDNFSALKQLDINSQSPLHFLTWTPQTIQALYFFCNSKPEELINLLLEPKGDGRRFINDVIEEPILLDALLRIGDEPDWLPKLEEVRLIKYDSIYSQILEAEDPESMTFWKKKIKRPENQPLRLLEKSIGFYASFEQILRFYSSDKIREEIEKPESALIFAALENPHSFARLLAFYKDEPLKLKKILQTKDANNISLFNLACQNPLNLATILNLIEVSDLVINTETLMKAFRSPESLSRLLEFYDAEQLRSIFQDEKLWERFLSEPESVRVYLNHLVAVIDVKVYQAQLESLLALAAITNAHSLKIILDSIGLNKQELILKPLSNGRNLFEYATIGNLAVLLEPFEDQLGIIGSHFLPLCWRRVDLLRYLYRDIFAQNAQAFLDFLEQNIESPLVMIDHMKSPVYSNFFWDEVLVDETLKQQLFRQVLADPHVFLKLSKAMQSMIVQAVTVEDIIANIVTNHQNYPSEFLHQQLCHLPLQQEVAPKLVESLIGLINESFKNEEYQTTLIKFLGEEKIRQIYQDFDLSPIFTFTEADKLNAFTRLLKLYPNQVERLLLLRKKNSEGHTLFEALRHHELIMSNLSPVFREVMRLKQEELASNPNEVLEFGIALEKVVLSLESASIKPATINEFVTAVLEHQDLTEIRAKIGCEMPMQGMMFLPHIDFESLEPHLIKLGLSR